MRYGLIRSLYVKGYYDLGHMFVFAVKFIWMALINILVDYV